MRRIELKKGWIVENCEGRFLNQNFLWTEIEREKAYVREGDPDDLMLIFEKCGDGACIIYPAMVFNGHLLFGKPVTRTCAERSSWN